MATIPHTLAGIKAHVDKYIPPGVIEEACRKDGHVWRERKLGPAVTVHLFLLQLLAQVALSGLQRVSGLAVSAQAFCKARRRLPLAVLERLISAVQIPGKTKGSLWRGLRIRLVDGMSFLTADTPELTKKYGKASNHKGASNGYPVPKLLASVDLFSGMIRKVIALPWARNERTCLDRLLRLMCRGDLMLADRGLVSFAHIALCLKRGIHCLLRLPKGLQVHGRGKGRRRLIQRLGKQDLLVCWKKPDRRPAWMSRQRFALLPEQLMLRQVAFRLHRPGFRSTWVWVITTLSVAKLYPAKEIATLYGKRWQIEVYFRDIRKSLGLTQLSARTVAGVRKEILAFVLLYNLTRRTMMEAAARQKVAPDRLSFIDALRWLLWSPPGAEPPKLIVNPRRCRATEPRRLKRGRKRFPQLRDPRASSRQPRAEVKI